MSHIRYKVSYQLLIATVLHKYRGKAGKTQAEMSEEADMAQSVISRMELGQALTLTNLLKVCRYFRIEPWELFKDVDKIRAILEVSDVLVRDEEILYDDEIYTAVQDRTMVYRLVAALGSNALI